MIIYIMLFMSTLSVSILDFIVVYKPKGLGMIYYYLVNILSYVHTTLNKINN